MNSTEPEQPKHYFWHILAVHLLIFGIFWIQTGGDIAATAFGGIDFISLYFITIIANTSIAIILAIVKLDFNVHPKQLQALSISFLAVAGLIFLIGIPVCMSSLDGI